MVTQLRWGGRRLPSFTIFRFNFPLYLELVFKLRVVSCPPVSPGGELITSGQSAARRRPSVGGVHGAVAPLLLLLLLQEELLQRRRARLHHGARPDRLGG